MSQDEQYVQTVLGPIDPEDLGNTLIHEHVFIDFLAVPEQAQESHSMAYEKDEERDARWSEPISLSNYYEARRNPFLFRDALQMTDEEEAVSALEDYRDAGGDTVVDLTPIGVGRDPHKLARVSEKASVNLVMGTGFYVRDYHPPAVEQMSEDEVFRHIVKDVTEGTEQDGRVVRPGIIGEIGLSWPVHAEERKVLRAAARAQVETGLALTIHPGRDTAAPIEAVGIVEEAGGNVERTIIDHLDRTLFDTKEMLELAGSGCYLEFDLFGWETAHYPLSDIDMPNDARRVEYLLTLIEAGYGDRLLVSLDVDNKTRRRLYGGEGYEHILQNVVPIMLRKGMDQSDINRVLVENPRHCLTIG